MAEDPEETSAAGEEAAEGQDAEAEEAPALVVACAHCGANILVEEDARPLVVTCPECGQRGVVKAPPPERESA